MNALNDCTKEQKLAILSSLEMISQGSESQPKRNAQERMIQNTLNELGLSKPEWSSYIQSLNPQSFQKALKSLSSMENEFYMAYIFELLHQNGNPTYYEETVAKNTCLNVSGISNAKFDQTMEKFKNMGNFFS